MFLCEQEEATVNEAKTYGYYDLTAQNLEPITCPIAANPIKRRLATRGVSNQIRKGIITRMEA